MTYPFRLPPVHVDTERFISRASLLDEKTLDADTQSRLSKPHDTVLQVQLNTKIHQPDLGLGLIAIGGCDILFVDVWQGKTCFCNVLNPGDSDVVAAMTEWDKAGFMRVQLRGGGELRMMRDTFKLNPVLRKAFLDSAAKPDFTNMFKARFQELMQPGFIEMIVAQRTGRKPDQVHVGFLATANTELGFPQVTRETR